MVASLKRTVFAAGAAALLLSAGSAFAQTEVFNEDFSDATAGAQQTGIPNTSEIWATTFYYQSPVIDPNWTFSNSVFLAREIGSSGPTGDQAIQLNEAPGNALAVKVPGVSPISGETQYTLQFDHWGDNIPDNDGYTFQVKADSTVIGTITRTFSLGGPGATTILSFTAPTNSFVLSFQDLSSGPASAILDNIILTAIPEPEVYAMMLAGFGLLGFVARRRTRLLRTA